MKLELCEPQLSVLVNGGPTLCSQLGLLGKSELIRRLKNGKFHVDHTGYFRTRECRYVSIIFLAIFSGDIP